MQHHNISPTKFPGLIVIVPEIRKNNVLKILSIWQSKSSLRIVNSYYIFDLELN